MTKPTNSQIIQAVLDVIAAIGMALLALFKQTTLLDVLAVTIRLIFFLYGVFFMAIQDSGSNYQFYDNKLRTAYKLEII